MRQYQIITKDGEIKRMSHIGVNYNNLKEEQKDYLSSYDKAFVESDEIVIPNGNKLSYCTIGDIKEAYVIFRNNIASNRPRNVEDYIACIQNVMLAYFGNLFNAKKRKLNEKYKVSDLAHKNSAIGIERAMLAQNLLWEIDVKSIFKISMVIVDNKPIIHAYNIVSYDDKHYIFDSTLQSVRNGFISPIICEIPNDVYEEIILPTSSDGISVEVTHFDPLQNKDITVIYDANREKYYKVDTKNTKTR